MAVTAALLTADDDTVDRTNYNTASISPSGNQLALLFVSAEKDSGAPVEPTVTGNGLTWTLLEDMTQDAGFGRGRRHSLYRASGASPSAGAINVDYGATCRHCQWIVAEFDGVDLTTNQGVVQSVEGEAASGQPMTVTLAAFASATNATFIVAHQVASGPPTFTPDDGYTEIGNPTNGQIQTMGAFLASADTTPSITSSNTSQRWAAFAVEIAEDTGGGGGIVIPTPSLLNIVIA